MRGEIPKALATKIFVMNRIETLQRFANENNKDWIGGYKAVIQDSKLRVKFENEVVAIVDEKFEIEMQDCEKNFKEVEEQLTYMINR